MVALRKGRRRRPKAVEGGMDQAQIVYRRNAAMIPNPIQPQRFVAWPPAHKHGALVWNCSRNPTLTPPSLSRSPGEGHTSAHQARGASPRG